MGQIIHVFRKDVRRHWPEIVLSIAILIAFALDEPSQWLPWTLPRSPEIMLRRLLHSWLTPMVPIGWLFLIVRLVHGENLVGDRQFWVTRPYQWKKLITAKAMLMAAFINVPLLLVQVALVWKAGFPPTHYVAGLLWIQCVWFTFLILPMTTLSAVTSGLGQTVLVLLGVLLSLIGLGTLSSFIPDTTLPIARRIPEWFQPALLLGTFVVAILWQYARRRTLQSRLLLTGAAAVVLVITAVKPNDSFDAHAYPQPRSGQQLPVQLGFDPAKPTSTGGDLIEQNNKVQTRIPLLVSGIAQDAVVIDGMNVEVETAGGLRWSSGWFTSRVPLLPTQTHAGAFFAIDKPFFEQAKTSSAKIHISFAVTAIQPKETHRITISANEFTMSGNVWCSMDSELRLQCRSPLKVPFLLATSLSEETTCPPEEKEKVAPPGTILYAALWNRDVAPAEFGISPVKTFPLQFSDASGEFRARLCPGTPLVFSLLEESQRTRTELTIEGLRLVDYALKNNWPGGTATGVAVF